MKKILLLSTSLLLAAAPIATAISCNEAPDPEIQTWEGLSDGFLDVTMENEYPPYNFPVTEEKYNKIKAQAESPDEDIDANDGMLPSDAVEWINMILPVESNSDEVTEVAPFIGGIDPYMSSVLSRKMSTPTKTITPRIHLQSWDEVVDGWFGISAKNFDIDIVISAMAPDDDKKINHNFTNEYLLTENVIARRFDIQRLDAKTIANWKSLPDKTKEKYGKIAVLDFPKSDPQGEHNTAVKYFGKEWVEERGELSGVLDALNNLNNKYAFIEDIQAEELKVENGGALDYDENLFPQEPLVKSSMSIRHSTPKFVMNHINSYLLEEANLIEQDYMKFHSIRMAAYCTKPQDN